MESILVGRGSNHFSDWKNPNVLLITPTPGSGVVLHLWISYHTNVVAATRINHHYHQLATISHRLIFWRICHCLSIDLSINTNRSLNFLAKYVNGAPMFFFSRDSLGQDWTSMGILAEKRLFSPQMLGATWTLPSPFGYLTIELTWPKQCRPSCKSGGGEMHLKLAANLNSCVIPPVGLARPVCVRVRDF